MPKKGEGFAIVCSARRTDGQPCQAPPLHGQRTCRVHGGSTKAARAKAEERILAAADPAAAKLVSLMQDRRVPPQVQLAAARDLLDRAGLTKTTQLQIALKPYQEDIEDLLVDVDEGSVGQVVRRWDASPLALPAGETKPQPSSGPNEPRYSR